MNAIPPIMFLGGAGGGRDSGNETKISFKLKRATLSASRHLSRRARKASTPCKSPNLIKFIIHHNPSDNTELLLGYRHNVISRLPYITS